MSKPRIKNTATVVETSRVLRGAVPSIVDRKYLEVDLDLVCQHYEALMSDLFRLTERPNPALLKAAALEAYGHNSSVMEINCFADRIAAAISYVRLKSKSIQTGKKLEPAVVRLCLLLPGVTLEPDAVAASKKTEQTPANMPEMSAAWWADVQRHKEACAKKELSTPPAKRAKTSSLLDVSPGTVRQLYGLPRLSVSSSSKAVTLDEEAIEILTSQEDEVAPKVSLSTSSSSREPPPQIVTYIDSSLNALVRLLPHGQRQIAKMVAGPGNFAIAKFDNADGTVDEVDTELPNLLLNVKVSEPKKKGKAKAVMKKPAGRRSRATLKSEDEDEEEGDKEEDGEEQEESDAEPETPAEDPAAEDSAADIAPTIAYPSPSPPQEEASEATPGDVRKLYGLNRREKPKTTDYPGGKLRITIAASKSYITVQPEGSAKQTMLVGVEKSMAIAKGKSMEDTIMFLWDSILADSITDKQVAVEKRNAFFAQ